MKKKIFLTALYAFLIGWMICQNIIMRDVRVQRVTPDKAIVNFFGTWIEVPLEDIEK